MDRQKILELTERLDLLDERLAYKIRKPEGFAAPTVTQVSGRQDDLARYVTEMKEILRDLVRELAPPSGGSGPS
jgi:hypothetical protein